MTKYGSTEIDLSALPCPEMLPNGCTVQVFEAVKPLVGMDLPGHIANLEALLAMELNEGGQESAQESLALARAALPLWNLAKEIVKPELWQLGEIILAMRLLQTEANLQGGGGDEQD